MIFTLIDSLKLLLNFIVILVLNIVLKIESILFSKLILN